MVKRKAYPSDLSDKEWEEVEPLLRKEVYRGAGCKGKYSRREMLNSIFYVLRTGCQWTDLPHDFPPWKSVYSQFLRWREKDLFKKMNEVLTGKLRRLLGRGE